MNFWTDGDVNYLKENYSTNSDMAEIVHRLKRTIRAIQHKGQRIGLSRPRFPSNKPSKKQPKKIIDKRYLIKNKEKIYARKNKKRRDLKKEMKNLLGGKCSRCGYNKCLAALDFHHNQGNKEAVVSILLKDCSKQKALKEIKKCILLCANCHREVHSKGL